MLIFPKLWAKVVPQYIQQLAAAAACSVGALFSVKNSTMSDKTAYELKCPKGTTQNSVMIEQGKLFLLTRWVVLGANLKARPVPRCVVEINSLCIGNWWQSGPMARLPKGFSA